jgi:TetR/AcrR family transcriptional regulator, copper-responsive repressor
MAHLFRGTAHANGELKPNADPVALSLLASATLHTIAIRARAGSPRADLRKLARNAVEVICGSRASSQ